MGITDPPIVVLGIVFVDDVIIDVGGGGCVVAAVVVPCKDDKIVNFDDGCDGDVCKYPVVVVVGCGVVDCSMVVSCILLLLMLFFCSIAVAVAVVR